ncbi:DsbA family protein [Streptomyces sp. RKND-216]|uniref:thioredoxin domain-containing protein n=1 Tax=Streptomyces sp. RKND-216 TaxID=2562581 RepID=UPI00109DFEE2|nr:thioredoxin domain-containing protein [Streptomyces sp. RKND-216]THA26888.1 DsbA family protein [Streptomyces sp. RKND-216]
MSKRNSQEAKRAARERLRIEREKQAKKEKMRRTLAISGGIVAVLALAGGIGWAVTNLTGGEGHWETAAQVAKEGPGASADGVTYKAPENTLGMGGTDIVIGDESAKHTLAIYEDMRCPVCAGFEQNVGETVKKGMEDGDYKVSYTFGTFIDENPTFSGTGSKNSLSALGAALNESPEAFMAYKEVLFSKDGHPEEADDKFGDDAYLIDLAQKVDGLKGNKEFEKAVENGTYDAWAMKISQQFQDEKIQGTPTLKLDGEKLTVDGQSPPMMPQQFTSLIEEKLGGGDGGSGGDAGDGHGEGDGHDHG